MSRSTRTLIWLAAFVVVIVATSGLSHAHGFLPAVNYNTGTNPFSVATGDFNGDGKPDLAVANYFDASVSILLGRGDGTFQSARTLRVRKNPIAIVAGDLNGDGRLDLVTADHEDGTISVLLNSPSGFLPAVAYPSGGALPESLVMADFDEDGILDVVVAESGNIVSFLKSNGDGSFQSSKTYDAGTTPDCMVAGDFNTDGHLDLAVGPSGNILLGNGDGTFQLPLPFPTDRALRSVAVGDFNRDGKLDLVVADCSTEGCSISNDSDDIASVLLGNGDGTFQTAVPYTVGRFPRSVAVADFNGDGVLDVAVAAASGNVAVLLGRGDGTFPAEQHLGAGVAPWFVAVGDFNHDRATDLVVVNEAGSDVSILMNSGGTFVSTTSSQNPAPVGQSVTFTATVAPSLTTPIPTGSVTFADGATILATLPLDPSGQASFTTSSLSLGTHTIRTKYSGDPNFNPNTGKAISQIIQ